MNALALIPVILLLQASYFDMQGTIMNVISPSSLLIGNNTVDLVNVDASGLNQREYAYLMDDFRSRLLGKDVFVKDGYVYFNLTGSYNSYSINEMIQKEISDLREMRGLFCNGFCYEDIGISSYAN
ncbi:MAG: hypothetical protein PHW87_04115 [Methanothrix sp.]|nr:hypothetical protein [Methanothrix sp.]